MALLTDQIPAPFVTLNDFVHIVNPLDQSQNPAGSSYKATLQQIANAFGTPGFTGGTVPYSTIFTNGLSANTFSATTYLNLPGTNSSSCIPDFYVSAIHSCSPLYINPLNEGNVIFGNSNQLYLDLSSKKFGINTIPSYDFDVKGAYLGRFYFRSVPNNQNIILTAPTDHIAGFNLNLLNTSFEITSLGSGYGSSYNGIVSGDTVIKNSNAGSLYIQTDSGGAYQKDIKFYAGRAIDTKPDLVIKGSGSTQGYIGVNTNNPTERFEVDGKTKTTNLQVTSGASSDYIMTSVDNSGNAKWTKPNQVAPKNWISATSSVDQFITISGATYQMSADTSSGEGITLSANTRFVVSTPGVYNIQFSVQIAKSSPNPSKIWIWLSKNGTAVPLTNSELYIGQGTDERLIAAWNWVDEAITTNTYYEIEWASNNTNTRLDHVSPASVGPDIPSLILTITQL